MTARLISAPKRGCPAGTDREESLWKFSPSACGTYGFSNLRILHASATEEIVLQSDDNVHIQGGSGWLLQFGSADGDDTPAK